MSDSVSPFSALRADAMVARGLARAGVGIAGIPKAETKVGRKVGTKVGAKEAGAGEARAAAGWWKAVFGIAGSTPKQ